MARLATRAIAEEQMDADDLSAETYAAVIGDLAKVNRLTMNARATLGFLARAVRDRPFRLLDVGFGHGDMLRSIARWAAKRGIACELVGVDLNPRSEPAARAATPPELPIRYVTGDYAELAGEPWDVIVSSLVAHHMTHAQLVAFLRFMDCHARTGWLVNDLHRHPLAHFGFPILATIMRWHPMVKADGTLSIARSYRPAEWPPILAEAEIADLLFAFRVCKHVKSNAIVYARGLATVGIGAGQMNRLESARIAAWKAEAAAKAAGLPESLAKGSVVASDAFFPFADGLEAAAAAGVTAVIQPGGSVRDAEVIAAADAAGLAMVFTGMRHFRH